MLTAASPAPKGHVVRCGRGAALQQSECPDFAQPNGPNRLMSITRCHSAADVSSDAGHVTDARVVDEGSGRPYSRWIHGVSWLHKARRNIAREAATWLRQRAFGRLTSTG